MTLRQLVWAATARKRFEGEIVCYLIASLPMVVWGSKPLDPDAINPWKEHPMRKELDELKRWQKKRAWELQCKPKVKGEPCR